MYIRNKKEFNSLNNHFNTLNSFNSSNTLHTRNYVQSNLGTFSSIDPTLTSTKEDEFDKKSKFIKEKLKRLSLIVNNETNNQNLVHRTVDNSMKGLFEGNLLKKSKDKIACNNVNCKNSIKNMESSNLLSNITRNSIFNLKKNIESIQSKLSQITTSTSTPTHIQNTSRSPTSKNPPVAVIHHNKLKIKDLVNQKYARTSDSMQAIMKIREDEASIYTELCFDKACNFIVGGDNSSVYSQPYSKKRLKSKIKKNNSKKKLFYFEGFSITINKNNFNVEDHYLKYNDINYVKRSETIECSDNELNKGFVTKAIVSRCQSSKKEIDYDSISISLEDTHIRKLSYDQKPNYLSPYYLDLKKSINKKKSSYNLVSQNICKNRDSSEENCSLQLSKIRSLNDESNMSLDLFGHKDAISIKENDTFKFKNSGRSSKEKRSDTYNMSFSPNAIHFSKNSKKSSSKIHHKKNSSSKENPIKCYIVPMESKETDKNLLSPRLSRTLGSISLNSSRINTLSSVPKENEIIKDYSIIATDKKATPFLKSNLSDNNNTLSINQGNHSINNMKLSFTSVVNQSNNIQDKNINSLFNNLKPQVEEIKEVQSSEKSTISVNTTPLARNKIIPMIPSMKSESPVKGMEFTSDTEEVIKVERFTPLEEEGSRKRIKFSQKAVIMEYESDSKVKYYTLYDENYEKIENTPQKVDLKKKDELKSILSVKSPRNELSNLIDICSIEDNKKNKRSIKLSSSSNSIKKSPMYLKNSYNGNSNKFSKKFGSGSSYSYSRCFSESTKRFTYITTPFYNDFIEDNVEKNKQELIKRKELVLKARNERFKNIPKPKSKEPKPKSLCCKFKANPLHFFSEMPTKAELNALELNGSDILAPFKLNKTN